jgi:hypothetical protein
MNDAFHRDRDGQLEGTEYVMKIVYYEEDDIQCLSSLWGVGARDNFISRGGGSSFREFS